MCFSPIPIQENILLSQNTVDLNYLDYEAEASSPDSLTLLFIHGHESSKETWLPVINLLQKNHRIVALDLRGHGESPFGNGDFSVDQFIADIHHFIVEKKLKNIVIVSHSMGTRIAIPYIERHPEAIQALVIEDMDLLPRERVELEKNEVKDLKKFQPDHPTLSEATNELASYDYSTVKIESWIRQGRIKQLSGNYHIGVHPYVSFMTKNTCLASDQALQTFSKLGKLPVCLLTATIESGVSEGGLDQMKALLPSMVVMDVPGAAHSIHKTASEAFVNNLQEFIQTSFNI